MIGVIAAVSAERDAALANMWAGRFLSVPEAEPVDIYRKK
jgi:hypothetical protein